MGFGDALRDLGLGALGYAGTLMRDFAEGQLRKADGEGPETSTGGGSEDTAKNNPVPDKPASEDPKSLFFDPFAIVEQLGYKDKPSNITYGTLKAIAWKTPAVQAVIQTRINQIGSFSRIQSNRYELGYRIKTRDTNKEPTRAEKKWIEQMESLINRTGVTENPRGRDDFETFLKKLAFDMLVYDQTCFEVVPDRRGRPVEWYAIDAASVRIADSASTFVDEDKTKATRYVQVYDGMVITEYNQEDLCFGVRNPRSDLRVYGYGTSELEMLVPAITSLLWAWEYNQKFFSQGSAAKGIINFKGTIPEKSLQAFRRQWYAQLSSVANAWRTPITNSEDLQWINLQQSSRDMEFNAWMDFLIKVCCAMYCMDPAEINFKYGNTGQKSGLQEASNKEKITESKERGLRPLLRFLARCINKNIIWPLNESFEFDFVGLDAMTREDLAKLNTSRVKTYRTVDELRAEDDLEPLPDGKGEVILDSVWMQFSQAKDGAMQQQQAMGPGDDGQGGNFEDMLNQAAGQEGDQGGPQGANGFQPSEAQAAAQNAQNPMAPAQAAKPAAPAMPPGQKPRPFGGKPFGKSLRKGEIAIAIDL